MKPPRMHVDRAWSERRLKDGDDDDDDDPAAGAPMSAFHAMTDAVLRYKPNPKSEAGKARKRKARKAAKAQK